MARSQKLLRFSALLCAVLTAASLCMAFASCGNRAPALNEVRGRIETVLDASVDINTVLFGAGLPVYERDSAEEALLGRYYAYKDEGRYLVSANAKYADLESIEADIRAVYCTRYADSLCEMLFTGYSMGEVSDSVLAARYAKDDTGFFRSASYEPLVSGVRLYDYSSIQIDPSSTSSFLKITVDYRKDAPGSPWTNVKLTFVYENGDWYLDSPCY